MAIGFDEMRNNPESLNRQSLERQQALQAR
jgi:hypothetical protein